MISEIHTRQFGLVDILREGWRIYTAKLTTILPIVLIIYGPFLLLLAFIPEKALTDSLGRIAFLLLQQGLFLVFGFVALISNVGIAHIVQETVLGRAATCQEALRFGASRWLAAFLTNLLVSLILFVLVLLLIIPGIIWSVYNNFWIYAVANRGLSGMKALNYSKNLVRGQWWRVFGIQAALLVIAAAVIVTCNQVLGLIPLDRLVSVLTSLVTFLIASVLSVMLNVWFLNIDYLKNPIVEPSLEAATP